MKLSSINTQSLYITSPKTFEWSWANGLGVVSVLVVYLLAHLPKSRKVYSLNKAKITKFKT
jgi:hypothetical protein